MTFDDVSLSAWTVGRYPQSAVEESPPRRRIRSRRVKSPFEITVRATGYHVSREESSGVPSQITQVPGQPFNRDKANRIPLLKGLSSPTPWTIKGLP
jgi:hypothetical protein